nr:MAG TPA: AAA domain protein [Caudoviricetes sp.]
MAIDIFNIKPNVVTRDLSGKSFLIYGERKSGKTTNACKFPKPILLGFEKGYGFLDGIIAQPINSWKEALEVKKQLLKDAESAEKENRDTIFKSVIVDTIDIAYDLCEKYIVDKEGVDYLDETEKMRGYRALSREYDKFFQEIVKAGYTLICISHATTKQIKENGEKYDKTIPTVPDRGFLVVSRLVDVCAYASYESDEQGNIHSMLTLRGNKHLEAGSRSPYMSEKIPFTYEALRDDMAHAIDMQKENGATVVNEEVNLFKDNEDKSEKVDFDDLVAEIGKHAKALYAAEKTNDYKKIVAEYLGKGKNVKDCDESQTDMLLLILDDLKDYCAENEIAL